MVTGASGRSVLDKLWPRWAADLAGGAGRWILVVCGMLLILAANARAVADLFRAGRPEQRHDPSETGVNQDEARLLDGVGKHRGPEWAKVTESEHPLEKIMDGARDLFMTSVMFNRSMNFYDRFFRNLIQDGGSIRAVVPSLKVSLEHFDEDGILSLEDYLAKLGQVRTSFESIMRLMSLGDFELRVGRFHPTATIFIADPDRQDAKAFYLPLVFGSYSYGFRLGAYLYRDRHPEWFENLHMRYCEKLWNSTRPVDEAWVRQAIETITLRIAEERSHLIRYAHPDDRSDIIKLVERTFDELRLPFYENLVENDLDEIFSGRRMGKAWVIECSGRPVGCIALVSFEERICRVARFYIAQEYRSRGWGKRLYDVAEAEARERRFESIQVEVSRRSTSAIDFYLRRGFELVEQTNNEWEDNIYRKTLSRNWGAASV